MRSSRLRDTSWLEAGSYIVNAKNAVLYCSCKPRVAWCIDSSSKSRCAPSNLSTVCLILWKPRSDRKMSVKHKAHNAKRIMHVHVCRVRPYRSPLSKSAHCCRPSAKTQNDVGISNFSKTASRRSQHHNTNITDEPVPTHTINAVQTGFEEVPGPWETNRALTNPITASHICLTATIIRAAAPQRRHRHDPTNTQQ